MSYDLHPRNKKIDSNKLSEQVFICVCPSGLTYTKSMVSGMKEWRKIVMNYIKIDRLTKQLT